MTERKSWWSRQSFLSKGVTAIAVVVGLVVVSSLVGEDTAPEPVTGEASRCRIAPNSLLDTIEASLTVQGGGTIAGGQTVESDVFESVHFVAAEIDGPGLEGSGDVGVWAVSGTPGSPGVIVAVDAVAREFSTLGSATNMDLSMADDGARQAADCM